MLWTLRVGSAAVAARFLNLLSSPAGQTYHDNRGRFLAETFEQYLWEMPLGAAWRWGMMYANFGDQRRAWSGACSGRNCNGQPGFMTAACR